MNVLLKKIISVTSIAAFSLTGIAVCGGNFTLAEEAAPACCSTEKVQTDSTESEFTNSLKVQLQSSEPVIACKITDSKALDARKRAIAELFNDALNVEELKNGYRISFESSYSKQIVEFIEVERKCCPFFTFHLSFPPNNAPVQLDITGPPMSKEIFSPLMEKK